MSFVNVAVIGVSMYQNVQAGKNANRQAGLQALQMDYQAQIENDNALKTAQIIRRAGRKQVAQTNAAYAGAGVVVGQGSAGDVEAEVGLAVEHDAFQALLEGHRRGRGMKTEATMTRINGRLAQSAGYTNAMTSALAGSSSAMRANGWRTSSGPGFSGTQAPAPVTDLSTYGPGTRRY